MPDLKDHIPSGHGWVWPNADGTKARCGGPAICSACAADRAALQGQGEIAEELLKHQYTDPNSVLAMQLEAMKNQLLICLVNRLGGKISMPVTEIDSTGGWLLQMEVDQAAKTFVFTAVKKH